MKASKKDSTKTTARSASSSTKTIGILNGPNLDRLGMREPELYGARSLSDLESYLKKEAASFNFKLLFFQSNHEGALIDKIFEWEALKVSGVVFNPGAYAHTSLALKDAMLSTKISFIEVHLTNLYKREPLRQTSLTASAAMGVISGLGFESYTAALYALYKLLI